MDVVCGVLSKPRTSVSVVLMPLMFTPFVLLAFFVLLPLVTTPLAVIPAPASITIPALVAAVIAVAAVSVPINPHRRAGRDDAEQPQRCYESCKRTHDPLLA